MVNDVVILGAGVSGLTTGVELLKKGISVTILEKSNMIGGLAASVDFQVGDKNYYYDFGPHLFHTAHEDVIKFWREQVGDNLVSKEFYAGNFKNGKIYDYPLNRSSVKSQFNDQDAQEIINYLSSDREYKLASAKNYKEYTNALAGPVLAEMFFEKYPEKLWGIPVGDLSARFAPKRLEIRDIRRPFHSGPGRFCGVVEGGCGQYAVQLAKNFEASGGKIIFESEITAIETIDHRLSSITVNDRESISCSESVVVSTLPITSLSGFLKLDTALYFRNISLCLFTCEGDDLFPAEYDWLYFDDPAVNFHRVGVQSRFSKIGLPEKTNIYCCEIAYDQNEKISNLDELESALEALVSLKFIKRDTIIDKRIVHLGPVYPGYFKGHEAELSRIKANLDSVKNLYTLGSLAEYSYADLQVLTLKAKDLASELTGLFTKSKNSNLVKVEDFEFSSEFFFGKALISKDKKIPVFTIAEIGLCHNGSVRQCKKLIEEAALNGFSAAKIQTFSKGRISKNTKSARYYEETLDQEISLSDELDNLIFSIEQLEEIFTFGKTLNIEVFSTPFDTASVELLHSLGVPGFKISSMDVQNAPLLRCVFAKKLPVIVSTGMATLGDIERVCEIAKEYHCPELAFLHCVSAYPCPLSAAGLKRIQELQRSFDFVVGYSDHTEEIETPSIAIAMGARIIEKHVTLSRLQSGPDHSFSLEPDMQQKMIKLLKETEFAVGSYKSAQNVEIPAKINLKKSLYAAVDLKIGDVLTASNMQIKSPNDGIEPVHFDMLIGKRLVQNVSNDNPITWGALLNE